MFSTMEPEMSMSQRREWGWSGWRLASAGPGSLPATVLDRGGGDGTFSEGESVLCAEQRPGEGGTDGTLEFEKYNSHYNNTICARTHSFVLFLPVELLYYKICQKDVINS